ncbi:MAG TPA: ADP-ribosylglycohydrolase family protein [Clostridia bacterium]|nr:ADP-ribosylglycohydrolase family protein [Clostridia bacterium]
MFAQKLLELRKMRKISQETLAEQIGVSRQAIQKWEAGTSHPDSENLLALARTLRVSIDALLGNDSRSVEELRLGRPLVPAYDDLHTWDAYQSQMRFEYRQSYEEGKDIASLEGLFREVGRLAPGPAKEQLADALFGMILDAPQRGDFPYEEPSDLEGIRRLCAPMALDAPVPPEPVLRDKLQGAWLGRICGCLLGKPLEGMHTDVFVPMLKASGNFPLRRYLAAADIREEDRETFRLDAKARMLADRIDCAPVDDDTNYTVLASELLERHGLTFTPGQVSQVWVALQSKNAYCTAERVAFRNFVAGYRPPDSAVYKNPYREWIGAQIRADYFGYVNPGDPLTASDMAWRDASISHVKNGIYGEMFVAAMLACAAVSGDRMTVLRCGLSYVPQTSRFYERVSAILEGFEKGVSSEDCFADIHRRYDEHDAHDWCHTISNAEICAAALLYGQGDYGASICMAVQCGFDTDCNGATVGSVLGMLYGRGAIGAAWSAPIRDTLDTSIFGVGKVTVPDMVEKTLRHIGWKRER